MKKQLGEIKIKDLRTTNLRSKNSPDTSKQTTCSKIYVSVITELLIFIVINCVGLSYYPSILKPAKIQPLFMKFVTIYYLLTYVF